MAEPKKSLNVAVVGATGAVGTEMLSVLEERGFPIKSLLPLASARSAGSEVEYKGTPYKVAELKHDSFKGIDIALFSAGGKISIADDTILGREVALKELLVPDAGFAARFERELVLTARLQHPSIVGIHDCGTWETGEPFYVMKLVRGESLDRVIARHRTVAERIAALPHGIAVAEVSTGLAALFRSRR